MSSFKKVYLSEALSPTRPDPPPLHAVYMYTVYLFTQGRGKGGELTKEKVIEEQQCTKLGRKSNTTDYISSL